MFTISPASPDVAGYNLYIGDSPTNIDYSGLYASVDHPGNSYLTEPLIEGQKYCFALRTYDLMGNEETGPGLIACAVPKAASSCLTSARIKNPRPGHTFCGNRGTIMAEVIGERLLVQQVNFQARPVGAEDWFDFSAENINHPNPDTTYPYFIHVAFSEIEAGDYELRAVALLMPLLIGLGIRKAVKTKK